VSSSSSLLERFWYADLPALDGRVRFMFWGMLYYWDVFDYVERSKSLGGTAHWHFDLGVGLPGAVGWGRAIPEAWARAPNLGYVARATRWCWVLSALGLGGFVPRCVAATGFTWLCAALRRNFTYNGRKHAKVMSMFASIALAFAENDPAWSLDGQVLSFLRRSRRRRRRLCSKEENNKRTREATTTTKAAPSSQRKQRNNTWNGGESAAARKFVLLVASCSLFFAGVHKLKVSGLRWCDGTTLLTSIKAAQPSIWRGPLDAPRFGRGSKHVNADLQRFVVTHESLTGPLLGTLAIVGELGAPMAAVFCGRGLLRNAAILSFFLFHVTVATLMYPVFYMNCISYLVCLDWSEPPFFSHRLFRDFDLKLRNALLSSSSSSKSSSFSSSSSPKKKKNKATTLEDGIESGKPVGSANIDDDEEEEAEEAEDESDSDADSSSSSSSSKGRKKKTGPRRHAMLWTCAACVVVLTCSLQVEVWPFTSFALFAWHPSQAPGGSLPGYGYVSKLPYSRVEARRDARRCATTPWINPPCMNLRHGWHFDTWTRVAPHWSKIAVSGTNGPNALVEDDWPTVVTKWTTDDKRSTNHTKWFKPMLLLPKALREGLRYVLADAVGQAVAADQVPCLRDDPHRRAEPLLAGTPTTLLATNVHRLLTAALEKNHKKVNITQVAIYFAVSDDQDKDRTDHRRHHWCLAGTSRPGATPPLPA